MGLPLVYTKYFANNLLVDAVNPALAAPTLLAAAKIGLGQAAITPAFGTVFADCVECTFTGYAESATVVWGTPVNESDGTLTSFSPSHLFRATDAVAPNVCNNLFVTDGVAPAGTGILAAGRVAPGFPFAIAGDGFSVTVGINLLVAPPNAEFTLAF